MSPTLRNLAFVLAAAMATTGCEEGPMPAVGADGGMGAQPGPGGPNGPNDPNNPAAGPGAPGGNPVGAPPAGVPDDPSLQLRRLTRGELIRSLEHVLGPITLLDAEPDLHQAGFARVGARQVVTSTSGVERIAFAIEDVLDQVFIDPAAVQALTGCDVGAAGCVDQSITELGLKAWRRPLEPDEVQMRVELAAGCGEGLPGLRCVVASLLYSPNFLYRVEMPTDGVYVGYAMASRLSYFLWGSPPDDQLLTAAANGELDTADGVRAHAERMMNDPRARVGLHAFVDEWFRTDRLERLGRDILAVTTEELQFVLGRDGELQPWLDAHVVSAREELVRMVEHHVFEQDRDYLDLLTTDTTVVDQKLFDIYQLGYEEGGFPAAVGYRELAARGGYQGPGDDEEGGDEPESPEQCRQWCVEDCVEEGGENCEANCAEECAEGADDGDDGDDDDDDDDEGPFDVNQCTEECNTACVGYGEDPADCAEWCGEDCTRLQEYSQNPQLCLDDCAVWCEEDGEPNCPALCRDECAEFTGDEGEDGEEGGEDEECEDPEECEEEDEEGEDFEDNPLVDRMQLDGQFAQDGFAVARHRADSPRKGIMGTVAVLGQLGKQNETSPTRRGLYIMRRILCLEVGEPPDDIDMCHRPEGVSRRDSMENHHMCAQSCAGCHSQMDPIGFAMDDFDTVGRHRTLDDWGFPLNTVVDWRLVRSTGSEQLQFDSLNTMAATFRELPEATECVTRQVYRFATGRAEGVADQATIGALTQQFQADGRRLKPFIVNFTATDAFRRATAEVDHDAAPTLAEIQAELFGPECSACHIGAGLGGFDLTGDAGLMDRLLGNSTIGMPYVTPGDPANSYLYHKVAGTHADVGGHGAQMPPTTAIGRHHIERLRAWIEGL